MVFIKYLIFKAHGGREVVGMYVNLGIQLKRLKVFGDEYKNRTSKAHSHKSALNKHWGWILAMAVARL